MSDNVAELIEKVSKGDRAAESALIASLYPQLRALTASMLRGDRRNRTLQPTALVNELYLKVFAGAGPNVSDNKPAFFAISARAMQQVLIDRARKQRSLKRGTGAWNVTLHPEIHGGQSEFSGLLEVHEALSLLSALNDRHAQVVEMRIFGSLTNEEMAVVLGVTTRTVERDWHFAKAWLQVHLGNR